MDAQASKQENIIKAIAVGGGAGYALDLLYKQGCRKLSFLACDTNAYDLRRLSLPCYCLGEAIMKGIVEADHPQIGREAALSSAEDLKRLLADGTQMVVVVACMGGATGTGSAPVIARLAKEMGLAVVGIVTYPFLFDTSMSRTYALEGSNEIDKYVDALSVFYCEELTVNDPYLNVWELFPKIDDVLSRAVEELAGISASEIGKPICAADVKAFYNAGFNIQNFIVK
jgi:cell division protein FtsZ